MKATMTFGTHKMLVGSPDLHQKAPVFYHWMSEARLQSNADKLWQSYVENI